MATQGGPAKAVVVQTGGQAIGGPALPVAVVTDGRAVEGGPSMPVVVVTSGPVQGGPALPVVAATGAQASQVMDGKAIPVYVVSGAFAPTNTVLPAISGSGAVLSSTTGTWTGSPVSYSYQWNRNGVAIGGATSSTYTIGASDIGATLTVTVTATNASGGSASATSAGYTLTYTQKVLATSPIAYWPLADAAGPTAADESGNGRDGTYSNVTLGVAGIGDGRTAADFNGATSFVNIFSASLSAALNGAEGTIDGWFKVSGAGIWTDGTLRRLVDLLGADGSGDNRMQLLRSSTNDLLAGAYTAGAVLKNANVTTTAPVVYFHLAMTWSVAVDEFKVYLNGVQQGATLNGLGVWAGGGLTPTFSVIGATNTTPTDVWSGSAAHVAIWGSALSAATIAALASVP